MRLDQMNAWQDLGAPFFSLSNSLWALVPLEAWRRGLRVTLQPSARYTLSDGNSTFSFRQTRLTGSQADALAHLCDDKQGTREVLLKAGLPAPQGALFTDHINKAELADYAESLGFPVCIKPNNWAKARGVFPKVGNRDAVLAALDMLVDDLGAREIVVEQHIPGDTLRVFVAGGKVVGATWAEAANVTGDGANSIATLIEIKAERRRQNPHMKSSPLVLDAAMKDFLDAQGLSPESVPAEGVTVTLRAASNLAQGGDSLDVTDEISQRVAEVAIASLAAVPGLRHAGIDLLVDDFRSEAAEVYVNELNPSAGLGGHIYPGAGGRRDVAAAIVDQYFPGTRAKDEAKYWYFSLNQITRLFTSRVASEVVLEPLPLIEQPHWRTLRFEGSAGSQVQLLRNELLSRVTRGSLHGRIGPVRSGSFDLAIVGTAQQVKRAEAMARDLAGQRQCTMKPVSSRPFRTTAGFIAG